MLRRLCCWRGREEKSSWVEMREEVSGETHGVLGCSSLWSIGFRWKI